MDTKPEDSLTIKHDESLNGRFLLVWLVITLSCLRIAIWLAGEIVLLLVYGHERMFREHLQIVRMKPQLVVSNGDVLWNWGFGHFLIGNAIWMLSSIPLLLLAWKLLPKPHHDAMQQRTYAGWSILFAIFLFFFFFTLPLHLALILAAVLLAVLFLAARKAIPRIGET